jgi:hypothetical protein
MTTASKQQIWILTICLGLTLAASCRHQRTTRVLLIGNSYTFLNGGIGKHLEDLAPSVETSSLTVGSYSLAQHLTEGNALETIRSGKWNYVVLQEQSQRPVSDEKAFRDATRELDRAIRQSGARTILLMTWERPDSATYGVTTKNLAHAYNSVGKELNVKVAPAGLAFARALHAKPDLLLNSSNGHPTTAGTYLAAATLYSTIFERSPIGILRREKDLSDETNAFLLRIAGESAGY